MARRRKPHWMLGNPTPEDTAVWEAHVERCEMYECDDERDLEPLPPEKTEQPKDRE